jgi:hypothetical protein
VVHRRWHDTRDLGRLRPWRTITVYTDAGKVVDDLRLAGAETIAVLLVERSGRILAREVGGLEERKAERLAGALAPTPSGVTA